MEPIEEERMQNIKGDQELMDFFNQKEDELIGFEKPQQEVTDLEIEQDLEVEEEQ